MQGKTDYVIYRYHGTGVDTITTSPNADGEKIEMTDDNKTIKLYVKKFSTYAIAYNTTTVGTTGGTTGGTRDIVDYRRSLQAALLVKLQAVPQAAPHRKMLR